METLINGLRKDREEKQAQRQQKQLAAQAQAQLQQQQQQQLQQQQQQGADDSQHQAQVQPSGQQTAEVGQAQSYSGQVPVLDNQQQIPNMGVQAGGGTEVPNRDSGYISYQNAEQVQAAISNQQVSAGKEGEYLGRVALGWTIGSLAVFHHWFQGGF